MYILFYIFFFLNPLSRKNVKTRKKEKKIERRKTERKMLKVRKSKNQE